MTGPGRTEAYRGYLISVQAMSAVGGAEHQAHVSVAGPQRQWRGPFIDYNTTFPTEDEVRAYGVRIGMEVIDAQIDSRECRWQPMKGHWGKMPRDV